jgi:hypothetical protein
MIRVFARGIPTRPSLGKWTNAGGRFGSDHRAMTPIEPDKTKRTVELGMIFRQLVEDAKRLRGIGDLCKYAPIAVIYE